MAKTALLAALSAFLMTLEIPLPFAPSFYQIDLSEVPVLLGGFALGPLAALCIELLKNLLYLLWENWLISSSACLWCCRPLCSIGRKKAGKGLCGDFCAAPWP